LNEIKDENAERLSYNLIGTSNEIKLKRISKYFGFLIAVFEDLELVLGFLRVKERGKFNVIFPELENNKQYYVYHLENYIIRINTVSDLAILFQKVCLNRF
jgi:NDP-sugar pyrophosphorylase family protein